MENLIEIDEEFLKEKVYIIRGKKVMLDFDLANIYGYTTKQFNQQVKRNIERFDEDFRFQLRDEEFNDLILRSQIVTSRLSNNWGGSRYLPYAFTEEGIYMLMTVLKGDLATKQSKALIRLFKKMKDYIVEGGNFFTKNDFLEMNFQINQNKKDIEEIKKNMVTKNELLKIMNSFIEPNNMKEVLILNGKAVEANIAYQNLYSLAKKSIYIIDNYVGLKTLVHLKNIENIEISIFSNDLAKTLHRNELKDFETEYPNVKLTFKQISNVIHDRYIVIDYDTENEKIFHCGASAKDAGKKISTILEINNTKQYHDIIDDLVELVKV